MKVWTNVGLSEASVTWLRDRIAPHELLFATQAGASNLVSGGPDEACRTADIAFGQPAPEDVIASSTLKWTHLTSAGYTRYDSDAVRRALAERGATLTNSSGVYDDPCAQHLLAFMLSESRSLGESLTQQGSQNWDYKRLRTMVRVLRGDHVLIVGYGAIGERLVQLLAPFNVYIRAIRRKVTGTEPVPTFTIDGLDDHLSWADHVVNILPANDSTSLLFDSAKFTKVRPSATFYNIGRGDTVDQAALVAALNSDRLKAAYLDVTSPEPLPADHPLWAAKNCFITPHIGGGLQEEEQALLDHFTENFSRFTENQPLVNRVF